MKLTKRTRMPRIALSALFALLVAVLPSIGQVELCQIALNHPKALAKRSLSQAEVKAKISESKSFKSKLGKAYVRVPVDAFFSEDFVESLYKEIPKEGSISLILNHAPVANPKLANDPELNQKFLETIHSYAKEMLEALNNSLPESERGKLDIEVLRVAVSDGNQVQLDEGWHFDRIRYMTSVTNLKGAGTLVDLKGPQPSPANGVYSSSPDKTASLEPGTAIFFNGFVRHFMFPGQNAFPLAHRAPEGLSGIRLGIVIFFAPKNMNAPDVSREIRNTLEKDQDSLRTKLSNWFLSP